MDDLASDGPGTSTGWEQTYEALTNQHNEAFQLQDEAAALEKGNELEAVSVQILALPPCFHLILDFAKGGTILKVKKN